MAEELPEAPRYTPPEVAQVVAERQLRSQHKYTMHWGLADQRDENMWTAHDNGVDLQGNPIEHGKWYGTCTTCEYLRCG